MDFCINIKGTCNGNGSSTCAEYSVLPISANSHYKVISERRQVWDCSASGVEVVLVGETPILQVARHRLLLVGGSSEAVRESAYNQ